jgi:hypothetical protein
MSCKSRIYIALRFSHLPNIVTLFPLSHSCLNTLWACLSPAFSLAASQLRSNTTFILCKYNCLTWILWIYADWILFLTTYPNIPICCMMDISKLVRAWGLCCCAIKKQIKLGYGLRTTTLNACCFCYHCSSSHDIGFSIAALLLAILDMQKAQSITVRSKKLNASKWNNMDIWFILILSLLHSRSSRAHAAKILFDKRFDKDHSMLKQQNLHKIKS